MPTSATIVSSNAFKNTSAHAYMPRRVVRQLRMCIWAQAPDLVRSLCKGCRTRPRHLSWKAHGASTRSGAVASQLRPVEACPARRKRAQRRRREPRNGAIQSSTSSSLIVTGLSALIDDGWQDVGLSSTLGRVCILDIWTEGGRFLPLLRSKAI